MTSFSVNVIKVRKASEGQGAKLMDTLAAGDSGPDHPNTDAHGLVIHILLSQFTPHSGANSTMQLSHQWEKQQAYLCQAGCQQKLANFLSLSAAAPG